MSENVMNNDVNPKLGSHCFPFCYEPWENPTKNGTTDCLADIIYGIELPANEPTTENLLSFIRNHQDVLPPFEDEEREYFENRTAFYENEGDPDFSFDIEDELFFYLDYYYYDDCYDTYAKIISDVAGDFYCCAEGYDALDKEYKGYVGVFAYVCFPWTNLAGEDNDMANGVHQFDKPNYYDAWKSIKSDDVQNTLAPLVKELYGEDANTFCHTYTMRFR